ncbi:recombinase family protein [Alkalinema pantanalense CENA528]|uniref:recombinase family protein n=1 Tax=Alkalinema pantanalense TaxID=1620705 RepID=UPI003D6DBC04
MVGQPPDRPSSNAKPLAHWITGPSRSGKTQALIDQFCLWANATRQSYPTLPTFPGVLVLSAIGDNRMDVTDRLTAATQAQYPFRATTPLGFFEDEVVLFWALLIEKLDLVAQFPLRLRPENEQELAQRLWQPEIDRAVGQTGIREAKLVRRLLDLMQLAALSGMDLQDLPIVLGQGLGSQTPELPLPYDTVRDLLLQWRSWCLQRGLLTYSLIAELYGQVLLPDALYQEKLRTRYGAVFADDVDEYPAIVRPLLEQFLATQAPTVLTYNPQGAIRLGLGADPAYLESLRDRCQVTDLAAPGRSLVDELGEAVVELAIAPSFLPPSLPPCIRALQTGTRAQLLRQTSELILEGIETGQVEPRDVAIIAPGLEPISRYALTNILTSQGVRVENLNEQRPLTAVAIVRGLLSLLTLVYPGLGRRIKRDAIAEMLVVLCAGAIDPVRAGLLADHCFEPHPETPRLLPSQAFSRWDRLGYQATQAYDALVQWIAHQQAQLSQRMIATPVVLLDRAIQTFFQGGTHLPFEQVASLRELLETAQHYWEVEARLRLSDPHQVSDAQPIARLIQLLREGAVTANPFPVRPIGPASNAVTLATVFQYRSSRRSHRWQFWLDAGSPRWLSGVDSLFAAPLFLQSWSGHLWTVDDTQAANEQRLQRILTDLLSRTQEQVVLCYSDLASNGQEQTGVLLSLVNAAAPIGLEDDRAAEAETIAIDR